MRGALAVILSGLYLAAPLTIGVATAQGTDSMGADSSMCSGQAASVLDAVQTSASRQRQASTLHQTASLNENNVLLGIALSNNGAPDVTIGGLLDGTRTRTHTTSDSMAMMLDRDTVFSALALGVSGHASALEALACMRNVDSQSTVSDTIVAAHSLDAGTVLDAIALHNAAGSPLSLASVVSSHERGDRTLRSDQVVSLNPDDVFLALTLGLGGSGT